MQRVLVLYNNWAESKLGNTRMLQTTGMHVVEQRCTSGSRMGGTIDNSGR